MSRKRWAAILTAAYAISFLFSHGPGLFLVNRPELAGGFPPLYLWALGWYFVQLGILTAAFFLVWRDNDEESTSEAPPIETAEDIS